MDYINIKDLKIFAHHGVLETEKINGQYFFVSATLAVDTYNASLTDDLRLTVNYDAISHLIYKIMTQNTFDLIETAANRIATAILVNFPLTEDISVTVRKPSAPINLEFEDVSVTVIKKYHIAYVALGSNLGNCEKYLNTAINSLKDDSMIKDIQSSSFIKTKPYGYTDQPDFLNACICFKTIYTPNELLEKLQSLEASADRKRELHWGPRTLDLDILFYDDLTMYTKDLIIPHPEIQKRDFVLTPLMELNPYFIHPILKQSVMELYNNLNTKEGSLTSSS